MTSLEMRNSTLHDMDTVMQIFTVDLKLTSHLKISSTCSLVVVFLLVSLSSPLIYSVGSDTGQVSLVYFSSPPFDRSSVRVCLAT